MQVHKIQNNNHNKTFGAKLYVSSNSAETKLIKKLFEDKTANYPNLDFMHINERFNSNDTFKLVDSMGNELYKDTAAFTRLKLLTPEKRATKYAEIFYNLVNKAKKIGYKIYNW